MNPEISFIEVPYDDIDLALDTYFDNPERTVSPIFIQQEDLIDDIEDADFDPQAYIEDAKEIDVASMFARIVEENSEMYDEEYFGFDPTEWETPEEDQELSPYGALSLFLPHHHHPDDQATILLFPTPRSYEIPAHLAYSAINSNFDIAEHIAIMKHWYERYGAQLFALKDDGVAFAVSRPPTTLEEAYVLAKEHWIYCHNDFVDFDEYVVGLCHGKTWWFVWD